MHSLRLFKNNLDFIHEYEYYLLKYEPYLRLFFQNLESNDELQDNQIRGGVYFNDQLVLIFLNAYPYNLQLFVINEPSLQAIEYLVNYIIKNKIIIRGIQGSKKDCESFIKYYYQETNRIIKPMLNMDILVLDKLTYLQTKGEIVLAEEPDLKQLTKMLINFYQEALGEDVSYDLALNKIENFINEKSLFVYKNVDGEITSFVKYINCLPNGYSISLVFTLPYHRGKGYAKEMMYLVSKMLLKQKKYLMLFVDQENPISNHVYKSLGFKKITENYDCRLIDD